jgi:hypothetical protein
MNRLVIVGNGFDLAHGLKTGYNDFLIWYLGYAFQESYLRQDGIYEDGALKITTDRSYKAIIQGSQGIPEFIDYFYKRNELQRLLTESKFQDNPFQHRPNPFIIKVKSSFIRNTVFSCSYTNWVEIENEYYSELLYILKNKAKMPIQDSVNILNESMSAMTSMLSVYLNSIPSASIIKGYNKIIDSAINTNEIPTIVEGEMIEVERTMILNFNYTSTVDQYVRPGIEVNYIHGQLNNLFNPLIFGFGDEIDDDYMSLEREKAKGVFAHIKSFGYFRTSSYHRLIRFIQHDNYQIIVLGHSCGLSDRTMLNMIFEEPNCKSIKIYHYKFSNSDTNYTELTQEISRHFKNKLEMRKKIVSFDAEDFMPQHRI